MLAGVISGAIIGLFFHQERWMDGYSSFSRRLTRLGHISFFGLGFINLLFAFSVKAVEIPANYARLASLSLVVGLVTMPLCCFATARQKSCRYLFPLPVTAVLLGIVTLLIGWATK